MRQTASSRWQWRLSTLRYGVLAGLAWLALSLGQKASAAGATPSPVPRLGPSIAAAEMILCDGQTFDGVRAPVFDISDSNSVYMDANVRKVIRNCTFRNISTDVAAIRIKAVRNLVLENNVFDNIRSGQAGVDANAVSAHGCASNCLIDGLWFEGNQCDHIGSDCIQIGGQSTRIGNVYIRNNQCQGGETYGENCVDVKSNDPTIGPLVIASNTIRGYRPCEADQDCSGSLGPGIVIHDGSSPSLFANGVQLIENTFEDNTYGLNVGQGARNTEVIRNIFRLNKVSGLIASGADGLIISGNTFDRNPTQGNIASDVLHCQIGPNTFIGKQGFTGGSQCTRISEPPTPTPTPRPTSTPPSIFADVPYDHPYHDEIEALYQAGYTAGCSTDPLMYCPEQTMNRAESAVFVERGVHGTTGVPTQPTTQTFADLPLDSWAAKWAEALWQDHYTAGCGTDPLVFCPWQGHTRAEGCVFYLRMLNGPTYEPPQPSQQMFTDVPLEAWYAKWVQAAYDAGLISACETFPELRFCPDDPLSRGLAASMMVEAKALLP